MKLEQNDKSLLFSSTEIPDVFFTEYLPSMNGDFIKVYFYILFTLFFNVLGAGPTCLWPIGALRGHGRCR